MFLFHFWATLFSINLTSMHSNEIENPLCAIQIHRLVRIFVEIFCTFKQKTCFWRILTYMTRNQTNTFKTKQQTKNSSRLFIIRYVYSYSFFFVAALTIHSTHTHTQSRWLNTIIIWNSICSAERILTGFKYERRCVCVCDGVGQYYIVNNSAFFAAASLWRIKFYRSMRVLCVFSHMCDMCVLKIFSSTLST